MGTRMYCVIKSHYEPNDEMEQERYRDEEDEHEHEEHHTHTKEHHEKEAVNLKDEDYYKYIAKYGHHFNKKLSEYVIENLASVNSKIPYDKVEENLKQSDEELDEGHTIADLHYIANLIKARHSNSTVKSDAHVVMLAIEYLNDPNKTEGEIFCEWFDSMKRKNKKICWKNFM